MAGIYSINMVKNVLRNPMFTKRLVYFANVQSHLNYALSAWGLMLKASNRKKFKVKQNQAVRAMFKLNRRIRLRPFYKKAEILVLEDLVDLSLLGISYRYVNDTLPKRIANLFEIPSHKLATRNKNILQTPIHTLQIYNTFGCIYHSN